uniref:Uncharacterized protein n=1 Tax=Anabas testudineus TaxID=64144 RepID=A0A3Q1IGG8_ANATE
MSLRGSLVVFSDHLASCCRHTLCVSCSLRTETSTFGFGSDPGKPHLVLVCENIFFPYFFSLCFIRVELFISIWGQSVLFCVFCCFGCTSKQFQ